MAECCVRDNWRPKTERYLILVPLDHLKFCLIEIRLSYFEFYRPVDFVRRKFSHFLLWLLLLVFERQPLENLLEQYFINFFSICT
jgi:hypothetical protein